MSGTALGMFSQGDDAPQTNFRVGANKLGCYFLGKAETELEYNYANVLAAPIFNFAGYSGDNRT